MKSTANGRFKKKVSKKLVDDIVDSLQRVDGWGSIEIFVQNFRVTQITRRNIKKTKHDINNKSK